MLGLILRQAKHASIMNSSTAYEMRNCSLLQHGKKAQVNGWLVKYFMYVIIYNYTRIYVYTMMIMKILQQ